MEGEEEMISDFIPDVRVDVPMPRCHQPKPDYSPQKQIKLIGTNIQLLKKKKAIKLQK